MESQSCEEQAIEAKLVDHFNRSDVAVHKEVYMMILMRRVLTVGRDS